MKIIEFSAHPDLKDIEQIKPIPAKGLIPDWYKKVPMNLSKNLKDRSIKACIPVLDSITAGYLLRLPQDIIIQEKIDKDEEGNDITFLSFGLEGNEYIYAKGLNLNGHAETHDVAQVGGKDSFYGKKVTNQKIPKILNPFVIKTPPGYSCLFVPPMHRESNNLIQILPAIVDTDLFPHHINFPFHFNADGVKSLNTILKMGMPYVQVIPFKRDSWKMKVNYKFDKTHNAFVRWSLKAIEIYKTWVWQKKSWK